MSGSVATFATFTVTLISAMSQLFSRLRSFAFITDAAEVTDVFRHVRDPEHARRAIRDFVNASEAELHRLWLVPCGSSTARSAPSLNGAAPS